MATRPQTLYEKIWASHVVERRDDGTCLIYIDRHLVHEVTSPQAFEGLRVADGSIMPTVISGNTNAGIVMIGEKCADMMLQDAKAALSARAA